MALEDALCEGGLGSRLKEIEAATIDTLRNNPYDFVEASFVLVDTYYCLNISRQDHDSGMNPIFQSYEKIGSEYSRVEFDSIILKTNGDLVVRVLAVPDLRFSGRLIFDE